MKKSLLYLLLIFSLSHFIFPSQAADKDSLSYTTSELTQNPQLLRKVLREAGINAATPTFGTESTVSFTAGVGLDEVTSIALTETKFVVAFKRLTNIRLVVGEITATTINFGSNNNLSGNFNNVTLTRLSDTEFALGYATNPEDGFIRKGTVNASNAITLSTEFRFTDGNDDSENIQALRFVSINANTVIALYSSVDLPGNFDILARVINLSSDPFTASSFFDVTGAIDWEQENFDAVVISPTRIAVAYKDDVNGKIRFLDISGNTISFAGAANVFYTGTFLTDIKLCLLNNTRLAVFYGDTDFSNAIRGRMGTIAGTTISFTTPETIANINTAGLSVTRLTDSRVALAYINANILGGQVNKGSVRILDDLTSAFDIGAEVEYNFANTQGISISRSTDFRFVVAYEKDAFTTAARIGSLAPPYTVTNLNDTGEGSLRQAIENSNNDPNPKTIDFDLASGGTINLLSELPDLNTPVTIDGNTAGGLITLNGAIIDTSPNQGLNVRSSDVSIIGLRFINFDIGIEIFAINALVSECILGLNGIGINLRSGGNQAIIEDNHIGTNVAGIFAEANTNQGIGLNGVSEVLIQNNLISGNNIGIFVNGGSDNQIIDNLIGTDITGNAALPNQTGITLSATTACEVLDNTIAGNTTIGMNLRAGSSNCTIENNKIGTGQNGTSSIPNAIGLRIQNNADDNLVRSNLITNNLGDGVNVEGTTTVNNVLTQNQIFCNLGAEISLTNGGNGNKIAPIITNATPNIIEGTCATCLDGEIIEIFSDEGINCTSTDVNPQARVFVGATTVVSGAWSFTPNAGAVSNGDNLTATATAISNPTYNNTSAFSNSLVVCESIASPTSLTANNVSTTGFTLNWTAMTGATGYRLTIAESSDFTNVVSGYNNLPVATNTQVVTGLAPNTAYFISLQSENTCATSTPPLITSQFTLPPAPVATQASNITGSSFQANWQAIAGSDPAYTIEVATDIAFTNIISQVSSITNSIEISGLSPLTTYHYRVIAVNPAGSSAPSNTITVSTTSATPAPTELTVTVLSIIRIELNWQDNSTTETSYRVERRTGLTGQFVEIATLPANTTTFEDQGLNINAEYCYRVRAEVATVGFSEYSNVACAQTANVPVPPFNLSGAALNFNQILLNWEYSGTGAVGFRLERSSPFTNGQFVEIAAIEIGNRTYIDNDVIGNVSYRYRIRAFSSAGNSPFSNRATVTTPIDPSAGVPVAPFNLQAISISPRQIDLVWEYTSDPNVIFKIERSQGTPDNFQPHVDFVSLGFSNTKRFNDTINIINNTVYYYRVRACTSGGESSYSQVVSAAAVCNLQVVVIRDDSGSETICGGKTASMTISNLIFGASYQWRKNGEDIPGANFSNYFASETGQYSCEVSVGFGGACSAVSINQLLVVVLGSPDPLSLDFEGNRLQASVRDADRYEWFLNNELIPNANEDSFEPTQPGIYFVIAVIGNCASTSNLFFLGVTANDEQNFAASFQLSPNPATDRLHFQLGHQLNAPIRLHLIDAQGNQVRSWEGRKEDFLFETTLEVAQFPRGLYLLEVELGKLRGQKKVILY